MIPAILIYLFMVFICASLVDPSEGDDLFFECLLGAGVLAFAVVLILKT